MAIDKKCTKCGFKKSADEFHKDTSKRDGLYSSCKSCNAHSRSQRHEKISRYMKEWRKNNVEKVRICRNAWKKENHNAVRESERIRKSKKREIPSWKLKANFGTRMRNSLIRGGKGKKHWEDLVGFTAEQLRTHLEKRFMDGMTWENYGVKWEIDHIIPISAFCYETTSDIDFKRCWSLKNLQPLDKKANRAKSDSLTKPFQPSLSIGA